TDDDLRGELVDLHARAPRARPQEEEGVVDRQAIALREDALRLLDHDPALERLRELVALGAQRLDLSLFADRHLVLPRFRVHRSPDSLRSPFRSSEKAPPPPCSRLA